jgi:2-polyprenyl-3-methyl-5-hydroxy-6-metoxy-1,4-benzoquinol methylase
MINFQTEAPLHTLIRSLTPHATVLDIGCIGFGPVSISQLLGRTDLRHTGVDYAEIDSATLPPDYRFAKADLNLGNIPFAHDSFDLVVANQMIEHLAKPIDVFGEMVRVCKPGGLIYIEAPSERSLLLPGFPFARDSFFSWSLFDDPTHTYRPWTPQSLHRLARYWSCQPIDTGYRTSWKHRLAFPLVFTYALATQHGNLLERTVWYTLGWASYLIARKPESITGKPPFNYYIPFSR